MTAFHARRPTTQTKHRLTVEDLEQFTPQELAELLAQIVLVLRRLPGVPLIELEEIGSLGGRIQQRGEEHGERSI